MSVLVVLLMLCAIIGARVFRSINFWWICVVAITTGLLIGISSNLFIDSKESKEKVTLVTSSNCVNDINLIQSLALPSDAVCLSGVGTKINMFIQLVTKKGYQVEILGGIRDQPEFINDS